MSRRRPRPAHRRATAAALAATASLACVLAATVPASGATSPWAVRASKPGTVSIAAVACATTSLCTAVGAGATQGTAVILRTTDGGRAWSRQTPPAGIGDLSAVTCPTASFCLASGSYLNTYVVATSDGGATWTTTDSFGRESSLDAVDCVSAAACYAEGSYFGPYLFHSTDGGRTWGATALPSAGSETSSTVPGDLSCPDAATCYVARPATAPGQHFEVWRTTDAGKVVRLLKAATGPAGPRAAISCWSPSACMAVGTGSGRGVLVTTDGGTAWTPRGLPASATDAVGIRCHAGGRCVAATANAAGIGAAVTANAGARWSTSEVASAPGYRDGAEFGSLSCPSTSGCLLATQTTSVGQVFSTTDGATTWEVSPPPFGRPSLDAVACPSARHCVAVGDGFAMWSLTGGASWYAAARSPAAAAQLDAVACPVAPLCVAGGQVPRGAGDVAALYRSTNEGRTWNQLGVPGGQPPVTGLACPTASVCVATVATDSSSGFLRSTDGGTTWSTVAAPGGLTYLDLEAVSCSSATACLATGLEEGGAAILGTTDAGVTWHALAVPGGLDNLEAVSCTAPLTCTAIGSSYPQSPYAWTLVAVRTTDGGRSWSAAAPLAVGLSAPSLACRGTACHAVVEQFNGNGPSVPLELTSVDGAATWTGESLPADVGALSAVAVSPALGWVAVGATAQSGPLVLSST